VKHGDKNFPWSKADFAIAAKFDPILRKLIAMPLKAVDARPDPEADRLRARYRSGLGLDSQGIAKHVDSDQSEHAIGRPSI
jgi:hypothetical protein